MLKRFFHSKTSTEERKLMKINIPISWILIVFILLIAHSISAIVLKNNPTNLEKSSITSSSHSEKASVNAFSIHHHLTRKCFPVISTIALGFFGLALIFHKFKKKNLKWLALSGFAVGTVLGIVKEGLTVFSIINLSLWTGLFLGLIIWSLVRNRFNKRKN